MPIYEYECSKCGHRFEVIQKISDSPIKKCEKCKGKTEKLISSPAIQFKGAGWYADGYSKAKSGSESSGEKESGAESSGEKESGAKGSSESKETSKSKDTSGKDSADSQSKPKSSAKKGAKKAASGSSK